MSASDADEARSSRGMSDLGFQMMNLTFVLMDFLRPTVNRRVAGFGIKPGMTVVDYGCGPGRYATRFAQLVGDQGRVYAVDIHPLAIQYVKDRAAAQGLANVTPVLATGYDSGLPDALADMTFALDMFHGILDPPALLAELRRITKPDGVLILDDGHQPRAETKRKLAASGLWRIEEESSDHLQCRPA